MNKLLQSSANPENLSMTIQGVMMMLASIIAPDSLGDAQTIGQEISNLIVSIVDTATLLVGSIVTLIGSLRKAWNLFK